MGDAGNNGNTRYTGITSYTRYYTNVSSGLVHRWSQLQPKATLAYVHLLLFIILNGILTHIVAFIMVIATVVHVTKNTITDQALIKRAMVQFVGLLMVMSCIPLNANLVSAIYFLATDKGSDAQYVSLNTLTYVFLSVPVFMTPILIKAIFNPVANAVKAVILCKCRVTREQSEMGFDQEVCTAATLMRSIKALNL